MQEEFTSNDLSDLELIDLPFDIHKVIPQCHACVRAQLKKYEKAVDEHDQPVKGKFLVNCKGIPKDVIDPALKASLSDEEIEDLISVKDPVFFAKKYVKNDKREPWIARKHQEDVLRCTATRRVLRISRRTGKTAAVVVDILYQAFTNSNIKILVVGPLKNHVQEIFSRIKDALNANQFLANSVKHSVAAPHPRIELENGTEIRGFAGGAKGKKEGLAVRGQDADLIFIEECLPAGSLVSTSEFAVRPIETLQLKSPVLGGDEKGVINGEVSALGTRQSETITLSTALGSITCTPSHPIFDGKLDVPAEKADEVIFSLYHKNLTFDRSVIIARLAGFIYGDGWLSGETVGFSGQEIDLQQVVEDCVLLGDTRHEITIQECENKERGIKGTGASFNSTYLYPIFKDICPQGRKVYQELKLPDYIKNGKPYIKTAFLSGLFSAEATGIRYQKNEITPSQIRLKMISSKEEWSKSWFNEISVLLEEIGIEHSLKFKNYTDPFLNEERWTGEVVVFGSHTNLSNFINKIGYCYNAKKTVSANKFILFNHYKKLWSQECWRKNRTVRKYIDKFENKEISQITRIKLSTIKYHKNTYHPLYSEKILSPEEYINTIKWKENYVKLPIQKANTKHNSELVDVYNLTSTAANRFFAEGIFTHNCAFVDEDALQGAILPILHTSADVRLTAFSTPTPFKSSFYKFCREDPNYKEFHYTYKVLPWWRQIEKEKINLTEEQWDCEFLANFLDGGSGVYKPSYVDRALHDYHYEEFTYDPLWVYALGADWNEVHGTEFAVIGYNPFSKMFQIVETLLLEHAEYTQLAGVEKLIALNKKWHPRYVYADSGGGSTNLELLHHTAHKHATTNGDPDTARLLQTLRAYDSGASIIVKDPITHKEEKKPAKSFMVNASVRLFEQNKILISSHDRILETQLRNYKVERYTSTGNPVYGLEEPKVLDHRLDAVNLAIVAFMLNENELFLTRPVLNIAAAIHPKKKKIVNNKIVGLVETPPSRDIEGVERRSLSYASLAGKLDVENLRASNRPGWATDTEEIEHLRYLQRKQKRRRHSRPSRTNF
jgi:hypothetical protein